ncbi:MAG: hypothetical protein WBD95_19955 [Xanthobacteraceae bacterium]
MINKDRAIAARRGQVGLLDGDPFIDAQDWDITDFAIVVGDITPGKAGATVKFTNLGNPATVLLDLVKIKNDWRIGNITWVRDGKPQTLRGALKPDMLRGRGQMAQARCVLRAAAIFAPRADVEVEQI